MGADPNTNNMNTLPTDWCIEATEENFAELYPWWRANAGSGFKRFTIGFTLMSSHPDGSCYFANCMEDCIKDYPNHQPITIEQFRQITNPKNMNTLPTKWYIGVTLENREELDRWRQQVATSHRDHTLMVGHTLLSSHHHDGSHYYTGGAKEVRSNGNYADYQEITLEQFRQIAALPTKWLIQVTRENQEELNRWRQQVATDHRTNTLAVGYTLLSKHQYDGSHYYCQNAKEVKKIDHYADYQEITLEQFRQITTSTSTPKPMKKSIQISRELLNEYYEASTSEQKAFLAEHFKLDGTTTDEAIRGLHDLACSTWKRRIKKNHPDCFPEDSKHFDFSKRGMVRGIVSDEVADSLGMKHDFIQIRNNSDNPETHYRSFYLSSKYDWKLVQDGEETNGMAWALIPTKKKS
jgi:hypothetical protein